MNAIDRVTQLVETAEAALSEAANSEALDEAERVDIADIVQSLAEFREGAGLVRVGIPSGGG